MQAVETKGKSVELFKGFKVGNEVSRALHVNHVQKEATPMVKDNKPVLKKDGSAIARQQRGCVGSGSRLRESPDQKTSLTPCGVSANSANTL